jgi:hypothetical protein
MTDLGAMSYASPAEYVRDAGGSRAAHLIVDLAHIDWAGCVASCQLQCLVGVLQAVFSCVKHTVPTTGVSKIAQFSLNIVGSLTSGMPRPVAKSLAVPSGMTASDASTEFLTLPKREPCMSASF